MTSEIRTYAQAEKPKHNFIIETVPVTETEFALLSRQYRGRVVQVNPEEWVETSDKTPVMNIGAGPCVILYVHGRTSSRLVSGHFSPLIVTQADDKIAAIIEQAAAVSQKHYSSEPPVIKGLWGMEVFDMADLVNLYESYKKMLERIKLIIREEGDTSVDAHIFGQNFSPRVTCNFSLGQSESVLDTTLDRFNVNHALRLCGLPPKRIYDQRSQSPIFNKGCVDDTVYVPHDNVIYHYRRECPS